MFQWRLLAPGKQTVGKGAVFEVLAPLVLASASPRRAALLRSLGITFRVEASGVEETVFEGLPVELAIHWAREKALAVAQRFPDAWVLGADTIVVLGDIILGKPRDQMHAAGMLTQLSGRSHDVITGLSLANANHEYMQVRAVRTQVRFRSLSSAEIEAYVNTGEPLDKAGAYGIQGIGSFLVQSIDGSYTNVVGLPLSETVEWLCRLGIIRARKRAG